MGDGIKVGRAVRGISFLKEGQFVYGTAVPTYNATPEAALAFVKFISDPSRGERWKAASFELVGSP
jgi:hypothetical protein